MRVSRNGFYVVHSTSTNVTGQEPTDSQSIDEVAVSTLPSVTIPSANASTIQSLSLVHNEEKAASHNDRLKTFSADKSAFDSISVIKKTDKEKHDRHRRRRRRRCGLAYSKCCCCCIASILALILLLAGLAALLIALLTNRGTTTTTTTTTSTTSTSTTSTTSTTTTTSTSTTTTATTTTTSTTSTTSTSTTSTSSTSTSTTSTTSVTTTTTSVTTTTTTTPTPPCTPSSIGSSSNLLTASSGSTSSYACYAYEWTPVTSGTVTLTFVLQHNPDYWFLDDVSVYNGAVQMLTNGGFESGSFSPGWSQTAPTGCGSGTTGYVSSSYRRSGSYGYADGCNGRTDRLSQSFAATAGQSYIVSFWLKSGNSGSGVSISVTLS